MGVRVREKPKGSGEWWIFIEHQTKRKSKKIGKNKKLADEVAKKIEAKLILADFDLNPEEKPDVPTVKEYSEIFLETYSRLHHKHTTIDSYNSILDNHVLPVFGKMHLDEITRKDIKDFVIKKQNDGLSPNTVRICRAYLSSVLTQAVDDELIPVNPAASTGRYIKKQDGKEHVNPFTWKEKTIFEKTMQKHFPRYYPLFLCALRAGLREGELIALKTGDIDFNGGFIEVKRNCVRGRVTTPKNGKTRRVDISDQLAAVLKAHLTNRKKEALKKGWKKLPEWLFYNEEGGMIDVSNLRNRVFNKCLEKAKLRHIRIHDLRHTYATLRIQAGHNIADVSKQLGHHSIRITVDTYYHWIPGANSSEVNELDLKSAPKRTLSAPSHENPNEKGAANSANPL
ncbi:MAG: site-specific integrase [Desulfobacterales bacterium]|nr:MAG: site-specific integrase [Desulfobacterales bacterium]